MTSHFTVFERLHDKNKLIIVAILHNNFKRSFHKTLFVAQKKKNNHKTVSLKLIDKKIPPMVVSY